MIEPLCDARSSELSARAVRQVKSFLVPVVTAGQFSVILAPRAGKVTCTHQDSGKTTNMFSVTKKFSAHKSSACFEREMFLLFLRIYNFFSVCFTGSPLQSLLSFVTLESINVPRKNERHVGIMLHKTMQHEAGTICWIIF